VEDVTAHHVPASYAEVFPVGQRGWQNLMVLANGSMTPRRTLGRTDGLSLLYPRE